MTNTTKSLSVAQLLVLTTAAQRPDRMILPLPSTLRARGASKRRVITSLLTLALIKEYPTETEALSWRTDERGQLHALQLTEAGATTVASGSQVASTEVLAANLVDTQDDATARAVATPQPEQPEQIVGALVGELAADRPNAPMSAESENQGPVTSDTPSGKLGHVLTMIGAEAGATLDELVASTGWLPHTTRAAITRLKQRGHPVRLVKQPDRKAYCLAAATKA
jgi:hypothetical protein